MPSFLLLRGIFLCFGFSVFFSLAFSCFLVGFFVFFSFLAGGRFLSRFVVSDLLGQFLSFFSFASVFSRLIIDRFLSLFLLLSLQLLLLLKHLVLKQFTLVSFRSFLFKFGQVVCPLFGLTRLLSFEQCLFLQKFLLSLFLLLGFQSSFFLFILLAGFL